MMRKLLERCHTPWQRNTMHHPNHRQLRALTRLRQRQLQLALRGKFTESARYACRASRLRAVLGAVG